MRRKQKIINLFEDKHIYAIKQVVSIQNEEDLNQLWEHITMFYSGYESPSYRFFVSLYELSERFLTKFPDQFFEIIVEESDKNYYYTVWNKTFISFGRDHWKMQGNEYLYDTKKITVRIHKLNHNNNDQHVFNHIDTIHNDNSIKFIEPYTFIEKEDLCELFTLIDDLTVHLSNALDISLTTETLLRMQSCFSMISIILKHYEQVKDVAQIMSELSMMMNQNKEDLFNIPTDQITLIEALVHNFQKWLKILFVEGGFDINYMNASMRSDMEAIRTITQPPAEI